jgi:site-specific DNA-methyltransferase (adenine-specific)
MTLYYKDDYVTLYHGDCLADHREWLEADVLVTDPPYGIGWKRGAGTGPKNQQGQRDPGHKGIQNDQDTTTRDAALEAWGNRPSLAFGSVLAPFPRNTKHVLYWQKPDNAGVIGATTGWRKDVELIFLSGEWPKRSAIRSSVLRSGGSIGGSSSPAGSTGHPHSKPVPLLENLITNCPPGIIADPFAGSGSTLVAAKALGRRVIGVELEEKYCEIIAKRCAQEVLDFGALA